MTGTITNAPDKKNYCNGNKFFETRKFKKLRVSITPDCNLSCLYCHAGDKPIRENDYDINYLIQIILNLHQTLDLSSVRITGGEPTLQKKLPQFIERLKAAGIPEVNLTTNGILLSPLLEDLKSAGLDKINVSLDSFDKTIYHEIAGKNAAHEVFSAIENAVQKGFILKINSIIMKQVNENQILPLLNFAINNNVVIRFLELMKMGQLAATHSDYFFPEKDMLNMIAKKYEFYEIPKEYASTARYFKIFNKTSFGIIANHSDPFCFDCDRLRLDHKCNIYGCISSPASINLRNKNQSEYPEALSHAMSLKQKFEFTGSNLSMRQIGG